MNKKINDKDDTWKGVLSDLNEIDYTLPSVGIWKNIENELFPYKKRRLIILRVAFSLSLFIVFIFFFRTFLQPTYVKSSVKSNNNPLSFNKMMIDLKSKNNINSAKGIDNKVKATFIDSTKDKFNLKNQIISENQNTDFSQLVLDKSSNDIESNAIGNKYFNQLNLKVNNDEGNVNPSISSNKSNVDFNENFITNSLGLNMLPIKLLINKEKQFTKFIKGENGKNAKIGFVPFTAQFGLILGRNYQTVSGNFNPDNINTNEIGSKRISFARNGIQIGVNYGKSRNFELNFGFQLLGSNFQSRWVNKNLQLDPNTSDLRFQTVEGEVSTADPGLINSITNGSSGVYKLRLNYSKTSYAIPIGFTYYVADKKWTSYMRGGVNFEFIGRRNLSIDLEESNLIRNIELDILNYRRRFHLIGSIALGCEFRATSLLSIYLEPMYQLPLSRFSSTTSYLVRSSSFGIVSGIKINM